VDKVTRTDARGNCRGRFKITGVGAGIYTLGYSSHSVSSSTDTLLILVN
jgi:hypothetical protein